MDTLKNNGMRVCPLLLLGLTLATVVHSATFRVSPMRVYVEPRAKIGSITVTNDAEEKVTIQVGVKAWSQNEQGRELLEETRELIAFPKIFTLEKGGERVVRISLRGPPATTRERTYRLMVQELPVTKPGVTAVQFTLQISLPVFFRPLKEGREWRVEKVALYKGGALVAVLNSGNGHILVNKVRFTGLDGSGAELFTREARGWYVLTGIKRSFAIPLSREECLQVRQINATVVTGMESKQATVRVNPDPSLCTAQGKESEEQTGTRQ